MPGCPSEATILAFVSGELAAQANDGLDGLAAVEAHLADCDDCRMLVSELARGDALASTALATTGAALEAQIGPVREGDVLAGKYVVERVLGMGGMGVVVAAHHRDLKQRVAIKFLLPAAFEAPGSHARFLREARAVARIQNEHVARVMDVGTLDTGAPYLVMEYLDGVDLAERLRTDGPLPATLAVELLLQACEAIAEAHAMGIVHRDLKPANLFLTKHADGTPLLKVLDFGISKAEGGSQGTLTTTSSVIGSPRYMSPEQLRSAHEVDVRTDVWALGVILFELLSGKAPFAGDSVISLCTAIATEKPLPLRKVQPAAPEILERVVAACLVKDREARLPSIGALAKALEPFASSTSASMAARASIERIGRIAGEGRPHASMTTASGSHRGRVILGALGAMGIVAGLAWSRPSPSPPSPAALSAGPDAIERPVTAAAMTTTPAAIARGGTGDLAGQPTPTASSSPPLVAVTAAALSSSHAPFAAPLTSNETAAPKVPPSVRIKKKLDEGGAPAPRLRADVPPPAGSGTATTPAAAALPSPIGQSGLLERK